MRILLIRHGQSTGNLNRILQGQGNYPLTNKGKIQAVLIAKEIKDKFDSIGCIYSSDLLRAKETTEIVSGILGVKDITFDKRLREHDCGFLTGKAFTEELKKKYLDPMRTDNDFRIPEAETLNEMTKRIRDAFEELVNKSKETITILIITHGGTLNHLLKSHLDILPEDHKGFRNCSVNIIERKSEKDEWKLILYDGKKVTS